ncbi:MAG: heparan-alpha-glucosaminide N-acetyltransferase domain-containing protein [Ignavibacteria bacterium]
MTRDLTSQRVIYIDLLRFCAIFLMVHGHTVDVLLSQEFRRPDSLGFNTWLFFRGLTAPLFLFASGFIYGVRFRRTDSIEKFRKIKIKTIRRALLLIFIGYLMKSPTPTFIDWEHVTYQMLQLFFAIDILQLIGASLLIFLGMEILARKLKYDAARYLIIISILFVLGKQLATLLDWEEVFPIQISSWFSQSTGSLFPLFPWGAYLFLGGAVGIYFQRKNYLSDMLLLTKIQLKIGIIFILSAFLINFLEIKFFGMSTFWTTSPTLFYARFGTVLIFGSLFSVLSLYIKRIPKFLYNASKNSLWIYVVHVMMLYGSSWNRGVKDFLGYKCNVGETILGVITMWILMILFSEALIYYNNQLSPLIKSKLKKIFVGEIT